MANIRQVAELAGVSIATVSRILNGDDRFRTTPETRQAVLDAASRLHYTPQRTQRKVRLGCIMAVTAEKYSDPFFTSILAAAEEECDRQGASISFIRNYTELSNPKILQELISARLEGIFLMERIPDATLSTLRKHISNIIFIDNYDLEQEYDCIGFDHYSANWQVMHCLINHGYQRIALISGTSPNEPLSDTFRLLCYREALRRAGIPFDSNLVKDCLWDMELCARQTRELMSLPEPPEVIFAGSDSLASSVLSTIYSMGLRCPDDVGVIGFNNIPLSAHMVPPLTTVSIPTRDIGIAAVQRMMDLVRGKGGAKRKILFPTRLMERQSLKRVTK